MDGWMDGWMGGWMDGWMDVALKGAVPRWWESKLPDIDRGPPDNVGDIDYDMECANYRRVFPRAGTQCSPPSPPPPI